MSFVPLKSKPVFEPLVETKQAIKSRDDATEFAARIQEMARFTGVGYGLNQIELLRASREGDILSPEQASAEYGLEGILQFQEPISRGEAKLRQFKILQAQDREQFIQKEAAREQWYEKPGNLAIAMGTLAASPENYIPFGGLAKVAGLTKLIKAGSFAQKVFKNPMVVGGLEAGLGNLVAAPLTVANFQLEGLEYGVNDIILDVGLGGILGAGVGGLSRVFRASKVKGLRTARTEAYNFIKEAEEGFASQVRAFDRELGTEGRAAFDEYLQAVDQAGKEVNPDVLYALGKLQTALNKEVQANSTGFLNDFIMRTDFNRLDPEFRNAFLIKLANEELIPSRTFADFDRSFKLLELGRTAELPKGWRQIVEKLGGVAGKITVDDFIKAFDNLEVINRKGFLKEKIVRDFVSETVGIKRVNLKTPLNAKQAAALFDEFEKLIKAKKQKANPNLLQDVRSLQSELKNSKKNTDVSFKTYQKRFNGLKQFMNENPNLRNLTISDLKNLDNVTRARVVDFLKFFQEANPPQRLLKGALRGDRNALKQMYEQAKLNADLKDRLTTEQAAEIVNKELSENFFNEPRVTEQELLGVENVKFDDSGNLSSNFLQDEINLHSAMLDEAEIKSIDVEVERLAQVEENKAQGLSEAVKCGFRR